MQPEELPAEIQKKRFDVLTSTANPHPPRGIMCVKLRRPDLRKEQYIAPRHHRSVSETSPALLEIFKGLVSGKVKWPLFLYGKVGRGKTSSSLVLCDVADSAGYYTVSGLMDLTMQDPEEAFRQWEFIRRAEVAVLDELGDRDKIGDLEYSTVKRFADHREGMPAVYISNAPPETLHKIYDDRISSRLLCGTWFELTGEDRRMA